MMFEKRVEENYGRMPEEMETAILELQGREKPEEIGEVQVNLLRMAQAQMKIKA